MKGITFLLIFLLNLTFVFAQERTIEGQVKSLIGHPLPGFTITLNTPAGESAVTNHEGYYAITTSGFPTGVNMVPAHKRLLVYPSPAQTSATVYLPEPEGVVEVLGSAGQLLATTGSGNTRSLKIPAASRLLFIRFRDGSGKTWYTPLITQGKTMSLYFENNNGLKSAVQDTFSYQLAVSGNYNGLTTDTVVSVRGFSKTSTRHTQNIGIETGEAILKGKTYIIGKQADAQFYDDKNEDYINNRKEPYMTFALTNKTGDTIMTITSDENAEYEVELQRKEPHYYMIKPGKTHEALVQILIDSTKNTKNIGAANNQGENAMSKIDNMMLHMAYWRLSENEEIKPPGENTLHEGKTINWKKKYYFDEGFNFIFIDSVRDSEIREFTEKLSQEVIDSIMSSRNTVNQYVNDFFKNGPETWEQNFDNITKPGNITTYGYKNKNSSGSIGITIEGGVLVRAAIGFNVDQFFKYKEYFNGTLYQEQLSVETLSELAFPEKENTLDGGGTALDHINNHAITSVEWGQVRRRAILKDGDETKGVYGWDMDERALEAATTNPYIREFVYDYGSTEAIQKMESLINGTKSASAPSDYYEVTKFFEDRPPEKTIYTKDNYKELIEQADDLDRKIITSMFDE